MNILLRSEVDYLTTAIESLSDDELAGTTIVLKLMLGDVTFFSEGNYGAGTDN